ncbi:MAG: hypothetical protein V4671_24595 [Armatimonadota bacterium]
MKTSIQKIQKMVRGAALCGVLGIAVTSAAQAQVVSDPPANKPLALKVGVFAPSGKDVRRYSSNINIAFEAEYRIQVLPASNSMTLASVGYITGDDDFQMVPLTISQVFRDPNNTARSRYYYGGGFGLYVTKLNAPDTSGKVKGLLGGFLVVGLEGRSPLFGEVKYHNISKYDDKFVGGFQTTVGYRF